MCPSPYRSSDLFGWVDLLEMLESRLGKQTRSEIEERFDNDTRAESKHQLTSERRSEEDTVTGSDLQAIMEKSGIDPDNLLELAEILSDLIRKSQKLSQDCMKQISASINNGGTKLELDKLNKKNIQILSETRELRMQLEQVQIQLSKD